MMQVFEVCSLMRVSSESLGGQLMMIVLQMFLDFLRVLLSCVDVVFWCVSLRFVVVSFIELGRMCILFFVLMMMFCVGMLLRSMLVIVSVFFVEWKFNEQVVEVCGLRLMRSILRLLCCSVEVVFMVFVVLLMLFLILMNVIFIVCFFLFFWLCFSWLCVLKFVVGQFIWQGKGMFLRVNCCFRC